MRISLKSKKERYEIEDDEVIINSKLKNAVLILLLKNIPKHIEVKSNKIDLRLLINEVEGKYNTDFYVDSKNMNVFRVIVLKNHQKLDYRINYYMQHSSYLKNNSYGFLMDSSMLNLYEKAEVKEEIEEVHLRQLAYLYGLQARAKLYPVLNIKTNKVKAATHESLISNINEKEEQYFKTKGMDVKEVQKLLLEDYLSYFKV